MCPKRVSRTHGVIALYFRDLFEFLMSHIVENVSVMGIILFVMYNVIEKEDIFMND